MYKTINDIKPLFMKNIFEVKTSSRPLRNEYKSNLVVPRPNQVTFRTNSLRSLGPRIWNILPK